MDNSAIIGKPLLTQVAGRHGESANIKSIVLDIGQGYILKPAQAPPRGPREINFYRTVFDQKSERKDLKALQQFIPQFYESVVLNDETYMKLENLTFMFYRPCIMDLKVGAITWDPDAKKSKIKHEQSKFPPSQKVGFRFAGFKVFNTERNSFDEFDKFYCNSIPEESILDDGFRRYFQDVKANQTAVQKIIAKLQDLQNWFLSQRTFIFISSSLLLVYEDSSIHLSVNDVADLNDTKETIQDNKTKVVADVRMIDFAHVFPSESLDDNFLHGLRNVIHYLKLLLET